MSPGWPVPYILDPQNLAVDAVVSFVVSVLLTITVNAEGQAFVATFLGDYRPEAKDRFHFNAFLHLDVLGGLCYLIGGFGWPRTIAIDAGKFKSPRLYTFLTRLAGPVANLLLANIAASIVYLLRIFNVDPRVFSMVAGVNVTTAAYNLVPLPPLAAGFLLYALIPDNFPKIKWLSLQAGPFAILALALLERITHQAILSPYLNPLIVATFKFITG
jgi:Zn-dependent protease